MVYCICEVPNGKLYDSERNCRQMENHRTASSNSLQNKSYSRSNTSKPDLVDPIECIKTNKTIDDLKERWNIFSEIPRIQIYEILKSICHELYVNVPEILDGTVGIPELYDNVRSTS